jgi:Stm1
MSVASKNPFALLNGECLIALVATTSGLCAIEVPSSFSAGLMISVHMHSDDTEPASARAAENPAPAVQAPPNQKKPATSTRRGGGYYNRGGGRPQAPVATPGAEESPVGEKKYCAYNFSLSPFDHPALTCPFPSSIDLLFHYR